MRMFREKLRTFLIKRAAKLHPAQLFPRRASDERGFWQDYILIPLCFDHQCLHKNPVLKFARCQIDRVRNF